MSFLKNFLSDLTGVNEQLKYATWELNIQRKIHQVQGLLTPLMSKNDRVGQDNIKKVFLALNDLGPDLVVENFGGDARNCQLMEQVRGSLLNLWSVLLNLIDKVDETRTVVSFLDTVHRIMARSEFDVTHLCMDTTGRPNCRNETMQTFNRYRLLLLNTHTYIAIRMSETKPPAIDSGVVYDLPLVYAKILAVNFFRLPEVGYSIVEQISTINDVSYDLYDFEDTNEEREKKKKEKEKKRKEQKPRLMSRRNVKDNIKELLKAPKDKDELISVETPDDTKNKEPIEKNETSNKPVEDTPNSTESTQVGEVVQTLNPITSPEIPLDTGVVEKMPPIPFQEIDPKLKEVIASDPITLEEASKDPNIIDNVIPLPENAKIDQNDPNPLQSSKEEEKNPVSLASENQQDLTQKQENDTGKNLNEAKESILPIKEVINGENKDHKINGKLNDETPIEKVIPVKKRLAEVIKIDGTTCPLEENIQILTISSILHDDQTVDLVDTQPRLFSWPQFHSALLLLQGSPNDRNSANSQTSREAYLATPAAAKSWVRHWLNPNSSLLILFIKEWVDHVERMSKIPILIAFPGKTMVKVIPDNPTLNWKLINGYKQILEAFLSVLKNSSRFTKPLMICSVTLLHCEPLLINYYLHHTCSRTISYQLQAVVAAFTKFISWFAEFKEMNKALPQKFDIKYYCAALDAVLATDHHQFICRVIQLIYDTCEVFTGELRKYLISEFLLKKHFYRLFLHWDEITRNYFQQLLIFKVIRIKRSQLNNGGLISTELSYVGKDKFSFSDLDLEVEFSNDQALFGKIQCYIHVVHDRETTGNYDKSLEIYAPRAISEYKFLLHKYQIWENSEVEWKLAPLALLDSKRGISQQFKHYGNNE